MPNRRDPDATGRGQDGLPSGVPAALADLPWELPATFLGLDDSGDSFERAHAFLVIVPKHTRLETKEPVYALHHRGSAYAARAKDVSDALFRPRTIRMIL